MATITDWNAFLNLTHELALVEYDLRQVIEFGDAYTDNEAVATAERILFERFGVGDPI